MGVPFGIYQLHERVGLGGMAEVFRATTSAGGGFEKTVAIKRILPEISSHPEFRDMFIAEAKIASTLHHPNIAEIFDLGEINDLYFIAMEYVHGHDMRDVQLQHHTHGATILPVALALYVADHVCSALEAAHGAEAPGIGHLGLVHRDISPQNILLSFEGDVKVIDFGLVKAKGRAFETDQGVVKGKYSYLSPEQAAGERIDRRTDIFSLGICLWEWLSGHRLFLRKSEIETMEAIQNAEVPSLKAYNPEVDDELDAMIMRALDIDPDVRYDSAVEFQEAIRGYRNAYGLRVSSRRISEYLAELFPEDDHHYDHFADSTSIAMEVSVAEARFSKPKDVNAAHAKAAPASSIDMIVARANEEVGQEAYYGDFEEQDSEVLLTFDDTTDPDIDI